MTTFNNVQGRIGAAQPVAFAGGTNLQPGDKGPKSVTCVCDFSASGVPGTGYYIDISQFFNKNYFKTIQTIFLDNTGNNGYALVYNATFNQSFALPPGWQGYFPTLCPAGSGGTFNVVSSGSGIVNVQLINVALPLGQWAGTVTPPTVGAPQPVSDGILDATVSNGRQNVTALAAQFTATDYSGSIIAGGVSQPLFAANNSRQGFLIQNIDYTNTGDAVWVNLTGGAAGSMLPGSFSLAAGASVAYPGGAIQGVVSNAVTIFAATTGHVFSAIQW